MIQHSGHDTTRTAGWSRNNGATRCILFAHCKCVGINQSTRLQAASVAQRLYIIVSRLTRKLQWSGQDTVVFQSTFYSIAHCNPHFVQIVPYFRSLAFIHIFPETASVGFAPPLYFFQGRQFIDRRCIEHVVFSLSFRERTTTNTVHHPFVFNVFFGI